LRDIQCEVIADDYAIGFAEWMDKRYSVQLISFKEMLIQYKKENKL